MRRTPTIIVLSLFLVTASGCAGHNELKAPCASDQASSLLFSSAFAASTPCGPLVRQSGVSLF